MTRSAFRPTTISIGALAVSLLSSTGALAQSAPAIGGQVNGSDSQEIVVTGDRNNRLGTDVVQSGSFRNAKILDTPLTVAVIPSALLKAQQAVDLIDAVRNTPGVSLNSVGPSTYNNITIRGIAVDTRSSYKLDGTLNILSSTAFPLEDKDRVEILKGASALYYGFSPPSGIVNLVMKRPTPQFMAAVDVFGDSNGGYGGHVDVGNTVGIFGYRVNLLAAHQDTGIQFARGDRYLISGAFDLKPTDKLTITVDNEYFTKSIVEPAVFNLPNGVTAVPSLQYLDPKKNIGGMNWDTNKTEEINNLVKAVYKFNSDWDITGHWGRSHLIRFRYNPGFVPGQPTNKANVPLSGQCAAGGAATLAQYYASLNPADPTFGAGCVRYGATIQTAGYENIDYSAEVHGVIHTGIVTNSVLLGASRSLRTLAGSPATPRIMVASNYVTPTIIAAPGVPLGTRPIPSQIDDQGAYAFDQLKVHDFLQLLGGVRFSNYSDTGATNANVKTPYTAKPVSWSGGFLIKPVEWVSGYGTYIQGVEENSVGSNNVDNALQVFAPISSTLYEGGLKIQPRKNLLIQLSYFDIKRVGAYNERNLPGTNILHGYADATQTDRGFEGSVTGYVTKDLAVNAALTFLKARTYQAANPASLHTRPNGTPNNSWSVFGEYTLSWLNPGLKVSAGAYHTGSQALDDTNNIIISGYTTFDVGASYEFKVNGHTLTARVNGQNITNKRYWAAVASGSLAESLPGIVKFSLSTAF
jgi:iron complex outermembrane receptor protein